MKRILFVCTGNTCRSPMAEAILKQMAETEGLDIQVQSAGVSAISDAPASLHARTILKERSSANDHRSQVVNQGLIDWADLVLTMTHQHKEYIHRQYPDDHDKVFTLKEFVSNQEELHHLQQKLEELYREIEIEKEAWLKQMEPKLHEAEQLHQQVDQIKQKWDIGDPFGESESRYRECAEEMEEAIGYLLQELKKL